VDHDPPRDDRPEHDRADHDRAEQPLGARLQATRQQRFVGRVGERALFRAALAGEPDACVVLYLHGPGGIGKSTLLRRLADDAEQAGRPVVRVDGRTVDPSPEAFAAAAAAATGTPGAVLLVDTFERYQDLQGWLRREFLPALPADAVVVLAGRQPPEPSWRADLEWAEALRVIALRNLQPLDAAAFLAARGVPAELRESVLAFAGGHPLALSLAAEVAARDAAGTTKWAPSADVIATLLAQLIGAVPSPAHRHALEVSAHAHTTTEELLRAVFPAQDTGALFSWLRAQPYIESGPQGLFPHDVVRDSLDADLRWRDPTGYEEMHRQIRGYLIERARNSSGPDVLHTLGALSYLHRHGGVMPDFVTWRGADEAEEDGYRPGDRAAVRALAEQAEGAESAAIVDFWLTRRPADFHVYRRPDTGAPIAFMAWLRLAEPRDEEIAADPVIAAVWAHSRATGPLRAGEHLAVARFMVHPAAYQQPSPVADLIQMRVLSAWLRAKDLAWSYLVVPNPEFWAPQMSYLDQRQLPATASVGGRDYTLFAHDWRAVPIDRWLDRHIAQELFGPQARTDTRSAELVVLSRPEFDAAVRDALRSWRRADLLADNPLTRSRVVLERAGDNPAEGGDSAEASVNPAETLRDLLVDATDRLAQDPAAAQLHRAVAATFFHGVPTQEVAAQRLGMPFSTYRRHLIRGVERIGDLLWEQELHGVDTD
jgi:hypothetical protein